LAMLFRETANGNAEVSSEKGSSFELPSQS